jgi:hypothetical protein
MLIPEKDFVTSLACNTAHPSAAFGDGALAFILQLSSIRARITVRSRGGRWIQTWVRRSDLRHFRMKSVHFSHPAFRVIAAASEVFSNYQIVTREGDLASQIDLNQDQQEQSRPNIDEQPQTADAIALAPND